MRKIAGDSRAISQQGQRAAGQAAMSLDSLFGVYKRNAKNLDETEIKVAISGLFQQLDDPSAYKRTPVCGANAEGERAPVPGKGKSLTHVLQAGR